MSAPVTPPYLRERRPLSIQAFEFFLLWLVFGAILAVSFAGAVIMEPVFP